MKRIITVLMIALMTVVPSFAEPSVQSFEALLELARANNLQLKIDALNIEKLEIDQFEAYRKAGNIDYGGDQANQIIAVYKVKTVTPQRTDNALRQQKIMQLKHNDELAINLENKLADYVLAQQHVTVARGSLALLEQQAAAVKLKLDLGAAIAIDLVEADNAVSEAKFNLIDLENDVTAAFLELKKLVGTDFVLDFSYDIVIEKAHNEDIAANADTYLERDPAVIKARAEYEIQSGLTDLLAENYRPNLREYKQGMLDLTMAENARDDVVNNTKLDIVADYNQLQVYYKNYQVAQSLADLSAAEHSNNETKFQLGVISKLDLAASAQALLERQFDLTKASNTYNQAKRNYLLNLRVYDVNIDLKDIDLNDIYYR